MEEEEEEGLVEVKEEDPSEEGAAMGGRTAEDVSAVARMVTCPGSVPRRVVEEEEERPDPVEIEEDRLPWQFN